MALICVFRKGVSLNLKQISQNQLACAATIAAPSISLNKIGRREVVGYGLNGEPTYFDRIDIPMPAVRFKEVTPDIQVLREKEKGDWNKLTIEEKKALYRASFCQTLVEVTAPTGEWKAVLGYSLIFMSFALWAFIAMKIYIYAPIPETFDPERQKLQLERMIALRMNPVDGPESKYDYEKGRWKE